MISSKYILLALPIIFLATIALAIVAFLNIRQLSLPIPEALGVLTIILPVVATVSLKSVDGFLRKPWKNNHQLNYLPLALIIIQIIYETVIGTLSLTYALPASSLNCALREKWQSLFMAKDELAIRSIQDKLNCCGLNSVRDRAWPFSSNTPSSCSQTFGRSHSCLVPWRNAEQQNATYIFSTVAVVFVTKVLMLVFIFSKRSTTTSRFITMEDDDPADESVNGFGRLLIAENNSRTAFRDIEGTNPETGNEEPSDHNLITRNMTLDEIRNEWRDDSATR
ncbi:putative tetraspanin tsp3 [Golovinomyces cichoracearum]|uniref:Putative tetraspanin tsp3 n=1 Tax=Golovinomyces cichoracearum TaxID=62708 RepID=A0A420IMV7_9PEZI|nr:putative tetraspanin tsp3 [Golovinomyces cichoracearum]